MPSETPTDPQPIARVSTGMRVIDVAGEEVGRVIHVAIGDPYAVTVQEPPGEAGVLIGKVPHTGHGEEPDVPADLAARLLRTGYVKVGRGGAPGGGRYVEADQIAGVRDDVVELNVTGDLLTGEAGPG